MAGVFALATQPSIPAQTWQTVPNCQFVSGKSMYGMAMVAAPQSLAAISPTETLSLPLPDSPPKAVRSFGHLPLSFERNEGQVDAETKFLVRARGYHLFLTPAEAVMALFKPRNHNADIRGGEARRFENRRYGAEADEISAGEGQTGPGADVLRMRLVGAYSHASISGENELPGKLNYFIGNDPSLWRTNISTFAKVRYHEIYPGIDLVYYGNEGQLEYDFVIAPGADPRRIELAIEGADKIQVDERGDLRLSIGGAELCWHKPRIIQSINGSPVEIAGGYKLRPLPSEGRSRAKHHIAFNVAAYDPTQALVIDPALSYSTYLGGAIADYANAIAVDSQGCAYVTGTTFSRSSYNGTPSPGNLFPTTTNAIKRTFSLIGAVFVTKFNPAGDQMLYSTVLCGTSPTWQSSEGNAIAVDAAGRAVVTGTTDARDFPTKNALQPKYGGGYSEAFVAKLNPDGSALVFSTFLGGSEYEYSHSLALDKDSNIYVAGGTSSPNFPTTNAAQSVYGGNYDGYIAKMDADGTKLLYSTFLGGSGSESFSALAVDPAGHAYIGGSGLNSAVAKLSLSGSALEYSITNLVGMYVYGIAVDQAGAAFLTGSTVSETLPTTPNAFQRSIAGQADVFVAKLNGTGSAFEYLTYIGGAAGDVGNSITVDRNGNAYVAGSTTSADFPTLNPIQAENKSSDPERNTAFVFKLNAAGSGLLWSTYLGGTYGDMASGLTLDSTGAIYVAGRTYSPDFPVQNAFQSELDISYGDGHAVDAFVAKIVESLPPSVQIIRTGNTVSISWPVSAAGFSLEVSDSLAMASQWIVEPNVPVTVTDQLVVTVEIGADPKFYRLRRP